MNEFYDENTIERKKANTKFTAYLMKKKNGAYVLRGHLNGTAREADQYLIIPPSHLEWAEQAAEKYLATGALPQTIDDKITIPADGITPALYATLDSVCDKYEASIQEGKAPEWFWSLYLCNDDGGPVEWQDATYACFEVYDFDGRHDFDWLNTRLLEAGIAIPATTAEFTGDGETQWGHCRIYGYDLPLKK